MIPRAFLCPSLPPPSIRLAFLLIVAGTVNAIAGTITGHVRDQNSNTFLLGATVELRESGRSTYSSSSGEFVLPHVAPGHYTLAVSCLSYRTSSQPVEVADADGSPLDVALISDVTLMGQYIVQGTREGQARALQEKRNAANIMEAVSADAAGKLPDGNAAEVLRRVPGISVEVDQDEGRYVVLRGINSALNTVTLNNQLIGTPSEGGNRSIAMDSVPSPCSSKSTDGRHGWLSPTATTTSTRSAPVRRRISSSAARSMPRSAIG